MYLPLVSGPLILALTAFAACGGGDLQEPGDPRPPGERPPTGGPTDEGVTPSAGCTDGVAEATGARYRICFPEQWNGDLVLYAHGYIPPDEPLQISNGSVEGRRVSEIVASLGYAFATTSYRANGLVVPEAVADVVDLAGTVRRLYRPDPSRTFLIGFSEGGLVATLAAERHADLFDGALAACGPIGNFQRQIDYFGDVRVVFDYFFPGVLPGSAVEIPEAVRNEWASRYVPAIAAALRREPTKAAQLIRVTGAPVDAADPNSIVETAVSALFYNVFGIEDARRRLGGQPFDNTDRVYTGSDDDQALNRAIARHTADPAARERVAREFETTGRLTIPVFTLHTTQDPVVPQLQQRLYAEKVATATAGALLGEATHARYGHCVFEVDELLAAFGVVTTGGDSPRSGG